MAEMLVELGAAILQNEIEITLSLRICARIFSNVACSTLSKSEGKSGLLISISVEIVLKWDWCSSLQGFCNSLLSLGNAAQHLWVPTALGTEFDRVRTESGHLGER